MSDLRDELERTLIIKGLSPERAAKYFPYPGITSMQIRRWLKRESFPQKRQQELIRLAIERIQKEVPDGKPAEYLINFLQNEFKESLIKGFRRAHDKFEKKELTKQQFDLIEKQMLQTMDDVDGWIRKLQGKKERQPGTSGGGWVADASEELKATWKRLGYPAESKERDPEMEDVSQKVLNFFNELASKVDGNEKIVLDQIADSMGDIIELILMAKKYGVELPKV